MSTGKYAYDNFVRVECTLPAEESLRAAIHEVAHFTLEKNSSYGLMCFFLSCDAFDPRCGYSKTLRILEQGFECTNECYAYLKEIVLGTRFLSMSMQERIHFFDTERNKSYYLRYRINRFEELLLNYENTGDTPVFSDLLFILAASIDLSELLLLDLTDQIQIANFILSNKKQFMPDYRLGVLLDTYQQLLVEQPAQDITLERLMTASDLQFYILSNDKLRKLLLQMQCTFSGSRKIHELINQNLEIVKSGKTISVTPESIHDAFVLSVDNCVIPAALAERFRYCASQSPMFTRENCVVLMLPHTPDLVPINSFLKDEAVPGNNSALLCFYSPVNSIRYSPVYVNNIADFSRVLSRYSGTIYLYLDDYEYARSVLSFYEKKLFFRVDVPWNKFSEEIARQGASFSRFFLQKYTDNVFVLFGFCDDGNVIFSMFFARELSRIIHTVFQGHYVPCAPIINGLIEGIEWSVFRDIIAVITEDANYAKMNYEGFKNLRLI